MEKEKVYKFGTTVKIVTDCNYNGCREYHEYTLDEDMTESELYEYAYELAVETVQPEGWIEEHNE